MTVGISLSQGKRLEAIVITDSRGSQSGRQSDSANKMGRFSSDAYHGVIFGSGQGNYIEAVLKNLHEFKGNDLDVYVDEISDGHRKRMTDDEKKYFKSQKEEALKKASLLLTDENRDLMRENVNLMSDEQRENFMNQQQMMCQQKYDQFIEQEIRTIMQRYDQLKQENMTSFVLVAYDTRYEKIRQFHIGHSGQNELFMDHIEIGSGFDGANMYLAANLQGIGQDIDLDTTDLMFFAMNAYNSSSINQGVGGTPKLIKIDAASNTTFPNDQVAAIMNVSGAYLSRFDEKSISHRKTREYIKGILSENKGIYAKIGRSIGLSAESLKTMAIPYSTWQDRANQRFFNNS